MKRILLSTAAVIALTSGASAADLYEPLPAVEAPGIVYAEPTFNWTGFYVGVQGGYGWTDYKSNLNLEEAPFLSDSVDSDADGWLAGLNIGFDYQISPSWVIGIMADYNWSDIHGNFEQAGVFEGAFDVTDGHSDQDESWNVLARAGYLVNPQTLVYVLGGYGEADASFEFFDGTDTEKRSGTLEGWTVGAGAEWMMTQNVSFKGEYRYTSYDGFEYGFTGPDISAEAESDQHSVLVGLNFRWGMGP